MAVVQITVQGKNESRDALTSTARDVDLLDKAVGKLKNTAAALGLSFSAIKLFELGKEATLMAARYETLGVTMDVVGARAGYSAEQMDQFEQKLHKTGIAMIESRETLTKMASAHMDLAKSAELARIAQDAAVIGNTNSSEAFNRMIDGIQRGEVEILKTIGINVNFEQSYKKLAQQLGKTADELTETEKVTARTNAVLEKGKDISGAYEAAMGTAGKQLNSMKRYVDDLKVALGETFQDALIVMVEKFTGGLKEANTEAEKLQQQGQIKEWGKDVVLTFAAIGDVAAIAVKGVQTLIDALLQSGDNMTRTFDILAQFGSGNFRGGINALQKMRDMNEQTRDELKKRWTTATPYTDAANRMYADRAANKAADDEKKKAMEDRIKAEGEAARQAEETRAKAEAEEKRYLENIKNSIAGAKEYGGVMKDLGKERLQFANDKFSDSLKEDIELYKQGGRAAEDLIRSLKRYNTEANAVFNERLAGEKSALAKLGDLYSEFKARIAINSQSKEAKAAGLEVLKAYRDTAQGVISIEQDRYRTLLAGERQYAQQVLTLIQAKKQEIRDLKQAIVDADKAFQERMRGDLQGQYVTGQYAYLDNSLDPYEKRKAQIAEIRRLEAEYDAIADPALKQKKMMGLISAWEQLGNQVDIVTKKVRTSADWEQPFTYTGFLNEKTEIVETTETLITKEQALAEVMQERDRIHQKVVATAENEQKTLEGLYQKSIDKIETYKGKLLELDNILQSLSREIVIDLKVNGLEQITAIQGLTGQAATSPFSSPGTGTTSTDGSGSSDSDFMEFIGDLDLRASGGPVIAGRPYIVGERQPELFIPGQNGTILPSVGALGSNAIHFNFPGLTIQMQSTGNAQADAEEAARSFYSAFQKHANRHLSSASR